MKPSVIDQIDRAKAAVDRAIEAQKSGVSVAYELKLLVDIRRELEIMRGQETSSGYAPYYPRIILDLPDRSELYVLLQRAAYSYERGK